MRKNEKADEDAEGDEEFGKNNEAKEETKDEDGEDACSFLFIIALDCSSLFILVHSC